MNGSFNEKKGQFRPKMSNILDIEILAIFDISNGNFGQIVINIANFFS